MARSSYHQPRGRNFYRQEPRKSIDELRLERAGAVLCHVIKWMEENNLNPEYRAQLESYVIEQRIDSQPLGADPSVEIHRRRVKRLKDEEERYSRHQENTAKALG